jgi:predicted RNA-binding Zn-ribbon protein involved in translation (DUF1610 family)
MMGVLAERLEQAAGAQEAPACSHCGAPMWVIAESRRWVCPERGEEARAVLQDAARRGAIRRRVRYGPWMSFGDWERSAGNIFDVDFKTEELMEEAP